jgi:hypothetical protein
METLYKILEFAKNKYVLNFHSDECSDKNREVYIFNCNNKDIDEIEEIFNTKAEHRDLGYFSLFDNINFDNKQGWYVGFEKEIILHKDLFDMKNDICKLRIEFFK